MTDLAWATQFVQDANVAVRRVLDELEADDGPLSEQQQDDLWQLLLTLLGALEGFDGLRDRAHALLLAESAVSN